MNPNDFGELLCLLPPVCQDFHLSSEISQHVLDALAQSFGQTFMVPSRLTTHLDL